MEHLSNTTPDFVFYTNLSEDMLPVQLALEHSPAVVRVIKAHGDSIFRHQCVEEVTNSSLPTCTGRSSPNLPSTFRRTPFVAGLSTVCKSDGIRINARRSGRTPKKDPRICSVAGFLPLLHLMFTPTPRRCC